MWYVVQTKTGDEPELLQLIEKMGEHRSGDRCFVPLYEEVHRSGGKCRIFFRRFFPGYIFIDTDDPEGLFGILKQIPEFTRLLGSREEDGTTTFVPVGSEDEAFLNSLLDEGTVHVSYIQMAKTGRIDRIVGPLSGYRNHITKLDIPHRRAIVETEMFGKRRKIRFGLWTNADPKLPWLEKQLNDDNGLNEDSALDAGMPIDIGIHSGDRIIDETGIYGDQVFTVTGVDPKHRTVCATFEFLNSEARIEFSADSVSVVD